MARAFSQHPIATDTVVWAQSQPGCKVRLGFPSAHVKPDFADNGLGDHDIDAVDPGQIYPADALEFTAEIEVRCMTLRLLVSFGCSRRLRGWLPNGGSHFGRLASNPVLEAL